MSYGRRRKSRGAVPVPNFRAEASSSSACCRFRKRDMGVRDRLKGWKFPQILRFSSNCKNSIMIMREKADQTQNREIHRESGWKQARTGAVELDNMWGNTTEDAWVEGWENEHNTGKQRSKTTLALYRQPRIPCRHRPPGPSVGIGPSIFSSAPSKVIDSILSARHDSSVLESPPPLSCGPPPLG